jgi:hypothetical protein
VKTDSPDPADFATTRNNNLPTVTLRPMVGPTVGISRCAIRNMPTVGPRGFSRYEMLADFGAFFSIAVRDMPTVAQTVVRSAINCQWIRCRAVAKSARSEDLVLTSMGAPLYGVSLGPQLGVQINN